MNAPLPPSDIDDIAELRRRLIASETALAQKSYLIDKLEEIIARLQHRQWGASSERHPDQVELSLFEEAEVIAMGGAGDDADDGDDTDAAGDEASNDGDDDAAAPTKPAKPTGTRGGRRSLPKDLERVRVEHALVGDACRGACGAELVEIGEEVTEQLALVPEQHFVIQIVRKKYACSCKECGVSTSVAPAAPLPGSQASPEILAHAMVAKYLDGIPLARQERMAAREGLELSRAKLARWLIAAFVVLRPLYNLIEDELFEYDIVQSDDTGIQVLKEPGRAPSTRSALWIRRGGPPERPVVLVDYRETKSAAAGATLLEGVRAKTYLVVDAAQSFEAIARIHDLVPVLCNDHARRKFVEADRGAKAAARGGGVPGSIAAKAIGFYKKLYRLERDAKLRGLTSAQRHHRRRSQAVATWETFTGWARKTREAGVRDRGTRMALDYLLNHETGLRRYCDDGRLPISNIASEHVAKTIAVPRKNFLFADTPAGASASALIYSLIESARANGHEPRRYLTIALAELPGAASVEAIEELLPWNVTGEEIRRRYAARPKPTGSAKKASP